MAGFTLSSIVRLKSITTGLQLTLLSNPVTQSYAEVSIAVAKSQLGDLLIVDNMEGPSGKYRYPLLWASIISGSI